MSKADRARERKAEILRRQREFETQLVGEGGLIHPDPSARRLARSADDLAGWISVLEPIGEPHLEAVRGEADVWHLDLGSFPNAPAALPGRLALCYGKDSKCLDDGEGSTTCAEIIVARRLIDAGWDAGWWNNYSEVAPRHWLQWEVQKADLRWLANSIRGLAALLQPQSGIPDVLAWRQHHGRTEVVAVECKCKPDKVSEAQGNWMKRFQRAFGRGSIVVAEWQVEEVSGQ